MSSIILRFHNFWLLFRIWILPVAHSMKRQSESEYSFCSRQLILCFCSNMNKCHLFAMFYFCLCRLISSFKHTTKILCYIINLRSIIVSAQMRYIMESEQIRRSMVPLDLIKRVSMNDFIKFVSERNDRVVF